MKHTVKKLTAVLLAMLYMLLCACSADVSEGSSGNSGNKFVPTGESVASSIFGRNTKYDAWTPAEDIALPVDSSEILDMIQIEKVMYLLSSDGVYSLDVETGESKKLIGTECELFASHGETLYTYSAENGSLFAYSVSGELISESSLTVANENLLVNEFIVTDDYYLFVCYDKSGDIGCTQYNVYDKITLEKVNSINEKASTISVNRKYSFYKDNLLLKAEESQYDTRFYKVSTIDLVSGKSKEITEINVSQKSCDFDFVFNPKTETIIIFAGPKQGSDSATYISEYSLSDPDNIVHQRFYLEGTDETKYFTGVHENIVLAICSADNTLRYFDYLNPPESITLACQYESVYEDVISGFEKETGILVRTVNYGNDTTRLDIKLMAGDTDFDLFEPIYMHQHKYFLSGYYEDLSKYEGLKQRLDSDVAASFISKLGDTYVGIPTYIANSYNKNTYDGDGSPRAYSIMMSKIIYCAYNFDVTTKTYSDPDGKELYKLLKFIYDNPTGNEKKMPFGDDCFIVDNGFLIMNPSGIHKENTIKFLEYAFDVWNDDSSGTYLNLDSTDNVYAYWHSFAWDYVEPIYMATNNISQCDGKDSTIKELAREAAMEVRMRLEE